MVKRFLFVVLLFFVGGCDFFGTQDYHSSALVSQDAQPSAALLELLEETNIVHDGTLKSIVAATQKEWLRPAGRERWQVAEKFADKRSEILALTKKLGMIGEVVPQKELYKYTLLFGATVPAIRLRIAYLIGLWEKGIRFGELVLLSGQRPLDPERESKEILLDANNDQLPFSSEWKLKGKLPKTEIDMIRIVWDQADIPEEMKAVKTTFIDESIRKNADGTDRRPNTHDVIVSWSKTKPEMGNCLAISSQPFVGYQNSVIKTAVPQGLIIETVGRGIKDTSKVKIAVLLDTCARWLYQEEKRVHSRVIPD